ncbi:MAG: nucleotidyltransferase domain-containing protein [Gemmatimonadetes bacterium]|nr:nucleotidyltransferase domain-containing protein [Gemmatimonadota bacterium]
MADLAQGEDLLPGRPDDRHTRAARELLAALRERFPSACLAVSGSVGRGTHHARSDLDLIVLDAGIRREMHFGFRHRGIPVTVLAAVPGLGPGLRGEAASPPRFESDALPFLRDSAVVHDPAGEYVRMRESLARAVAEAPDPGEHALRLCAVAGRLLAGVERSDDPVERGRLLADLFSALLQAWCLQQGVTHESKGESGRVPALMRERDPGLHALLSAALPLRAASAAPLRRAIARLHTPSHPVPRPPEEHGSE